ncbi:serine carboxypeptidase-like 18 [Rutidosis leptorrhynchoides]|uniref:serine carboxypeptidase-like 18 n=1 Tax=Rutidosis leptorrhynchoides TaxID=125765 RepID=UPI003A993CB9
MQLKSSNIIVMIMMMMMIMVLDASSESESRCLVKKLPGYPEDLPFKLETGYIGVGENEQVQLFYYFVESEGNPDEDPLIVWLAGGPGCSTLRAFFFEIGPMQIQYRKYMDNVPALQLDPNSWTKVANVIYLDAPTLTGYSYTTTPDAVHSSDTLSASQTAEFLRKFVGQHPRFLNNPMYVTGISYSGIVIPIITEELYKGNDEGLKPRVNIQGYMAGNPLTDKTGDINSRLEYAYRMALISPELYESTKNDCNGEYAEADNGNSLCMQNINEVNKRVEDINIQQILDPDCDPATNLVRSGNPITRKNRKSLRGANPIRMRTSLLKDTFCRGDYYDYATLWANDKNVMKALHVREGTVKEWLLCNLDMKYNYGKPSMPSYEFNIPSSVIYHQKLSKRNCRALIFSGDHDMMVPHVGTRNWINTLNLTIDSDSNWVAWYTNGQDAGYQTTYVNHNYSLVFATVKGAGHTAPEFRPEECFELVKRWFSHRPI